MKAGGCGEGSVGPYKMLDGNALIWQAFTPLPVSVRLNFIDPTGSCALTPPEVRERYRDLISNSAVVVWKSTSNGICGLRAGVDEVAWMVAAIEGIELYFQRPAKGLGCVVLRVRAQDMPAEWAVLASRFDDGLLIWFRDLCKLLSEMIPCQLIEKDEGYDV